MGKLLFKSSILLSGLSAFAVSAQQKQPNILCITCEDIGQYLSCYNDPVAVTPNLDKFATEGIRYTRMFTTVGVSAPSRAALITGMYPSAIGANYMRNNTKAEVMPQGIEPYQVVLPEGVKCYTEYMRAAGYYCTNNQKTDYQFAVPLTAWDEQGKNAHWKNRPKGSPFFSIFNLEVTHESRIWTRTNEPLVVDPTTVPLPPYYPDDPTIRHDVAVMYSNICEMDRQFQSLVDELKASGEWENTIIIWYSDNGGPLPRQKRAIYDSGMLVPFMICFPNGYRKGEVEDRLCMFPDIPATILSLAGIQPPAYMHGQAFLGKYTKAETREYVYGARNRMDEQADKQGAVRDVHFRYVRNYNSENSNYNPNAFRLQIPMMRRILELLQRDSLDATQMRWFCGPRAEEEFYDLDNDPHEVKNLIANPQYKDEIIRLRNAYNHWIDTDNRAFLTTEHENRSLMYLNGKQPELQMPTAKKEKGTLLLSSPDHAASIAYQINGKGYSSDHWCLYTSPIKIKKGDKVTAIAVRAGMKDSPLLEYIIQ